jgi:hypothetical protein
MKSNPNKYLYWTPRILSILFVLFLALFSLDVFGNGFTFWQTMLGLLMHNIPSIILGIIIWISWKHELVGAITFCFVSLLYVFLILINFFEDVNNAYQLIWTLPISAPAFLVGILYYLNWKKKKSSNKKNKRINNKNKDK